ncbi:fibronectin type III domain-containing protein [bacterium]|nr:fibronectin type III domain-containing protein [bacterium]
MNYKAFLLALLLGMLILFGCSEEAEEPLDTNPRNLDYITYDDSVGLSWDHCEAYSESDFLGYFVFMANVSLLGYAVDTLPEPYNSDPVTASEIRVDSLEQGTKYYFHIRSAFGTYDAYTLGDPSNEVQTSPIVFGMDTLYEFDSPDPSAYYFEGQHRLSMNHIYSDSIDLFLGTDGSGNLAFKSPHIVDTDHPEYWEERITQIKKLGSGNWLEYNQTLDSGWNANYFETIGLSGEVFVVKTPNNHFVKVVISGSSGTTPNRMVEFRFAFQPRVGYNHF